ncbi:MAG TPA: hypothetical protein VG734_23350 [Lacunisphaera sp.]|nr:hypothetical protein [Lacunisphaera sp.]
MKLSAILIFAVLASACRGTDLPTALIVLRTDFDLEVLHATADKGAFSFRAYVLPSLSPTKYAIDGKLTLPQIGEATGSLTLVVADGPERRVRTFRLTHAQARDVYAWFSEAEFLDPKTPETVSIPVLDGIDLLIEGYVNGRYFRFQRNSGDSPISEKFFRRLDAFRIWKEEETNQTPAPTAPSGRSSA